MITEIKDLERKIEKDRKVIKWALLLAFSAMIVDIAWVLYRIHYILHLR